ncbi:MAG: hypothetical protein Q4B26_16300 [Eubacteriales bacterium]|nr:hypothetical protein [Eubacteriales bacterium]
MSKQDRPTITIDYRRNLIRIHKNTLHLLSDPEYIELLVNPESSTLAIRPSDGNSDRAHITKIDHVKSMEIQSAYLFRSLKTVHSGFETGKSYRLFGILNTVDGIVRFPLKDANELKRSEDKLL